METYWNSGRHNNHKQKNNMRVIRTGWYLSLAVLLVIGTGTSPLVAQNNQGVLFALLTDKLLFIDCVIFFDSCDSAIETVSLNRLTLIRRFSIGERAVTSLAVSPGGRQLYVTDSLNKEVAIFDVLSGRLVASVPVPGFILRDSVLSAGGKTLYVTVDNSIIAINTITNTIQQTLMTGADITLGIAISPDGNTLGAVSTDGGTKPALYLVDPGTLMLKARVPITNPGESTNCATIPLDIAFSDTGLALLWDSNCDNLYQVDVASKTQLTAGTIRMGRDNGSFFNFNNMLYYSPVSNRAYALKESQELAVMAPVGVSGFLVGGFDGVPFVPTLTPDGGRLFISVIHRFAGGGADTLDQYNTASETFTRNVYSFSFPNMNVRDMRTVLCRHDTTRAAGQAASRKAAGRNAWNPGLGSAGLFGLAERRTGSARAGSGRHGILPG